MNLFEGELIRLAPIDMTTCPPASAGSGITKSSAFWSRMCSYR